MAVITVSRTHGLYAEEILDQFSSKHNYKILSQELLVEVSRKLDIPKEELEKTYSMEKFKTSKVFLTELLQSMREGTIYLTGSQIDSPEFYPIYFPSVMQSKDGKNDEDLDFDKYGNQESYIKVMQEVIKNIAKQDNIIIVGRGSQIVLKDMPNVIHLRMDGSFKSRSERVSRRENISLKDAEKRIRTIDKNRRKYISYFYDMEWDDITLYHYFINTDKVDPNNFISFLEGITKSCKN